MPTLAGATKSASFGLRGVGSALFGEVCLVWGAGPHSRTQGFSRGLVTYCLSIKGRTPPRRSEVGKVANFDHNSLRNNSFPLQKSAGTGLLDSPSRSLSLVFYLLSPLSLSLCLSVSLALSRSRRFALAQRGRPSTRRAASGGTFSCGKYFRSLFIRSNCMEVD